MTAKKGGEVPVPDLTAAALPATEEYGARNGSAPPDPQGEAQSRLRRSRAVSRGASRGGQLSRPTTLLVSEVAPK